jgi:hypothetical protein
LAIHRPKTSSHHWLWQPSLKICAKFLTCIQWVTVLIRQHTHGKLAKPTHGPYRLIDVARQHVNGTIVIDLNHSNKMFNIWWLIPYP